MGSSEEAVRHCRHEKLHEDLHLACSFCGICCPTGKVQAASTDWDTLLGEGHMGFPYKELPGTGPDPSCPRAAHCLVLPFSGNFWHLSFTDAIRTFLSQEVFHFSRRNGVTLPAEWPHSTLGGPEYSWEEMHHTEIWSSISQQNALTTGQGGNIRGHIAGYVLRKDLPMILCWGIIWYACRRANRLLWGLRKRRKSSPGSQMVLAVS